MPSLLSRSPSLQDRARRNVNRAALSSDNDYCALERDATTQIHSSSDGEVVEFEDLGNGGDA